jgi:ABC-type multidrug transport system ATPase subunit
MTSEPAIRVERLCKKFRDREVLSDVSFTVPTGETFAFLGRNAAGKTTTNRSPCDSESGTSPKTSTCSAG